MDFWSLIKDYALTITTAGVIVALFITYPHFSEETQQLPKTYRSICDG